MANPPERFNCPAYKPVARRGRHRSARLGSARRECSNEHDTRGKIKPWFASTPAIYVRLRSQSELQRTPQACARAFPSKSRRTLCAYQLLLLHCSILSLNKETVRAQALPLVISIYVFFDVLLVERIKDTLTEWVLFCFTYIVDENP